MSLTKYTTCALKNPFAINPRLKKIMGGVDSVLGPPTNTTLQKDSMLLGRLKALVLKRMKEAYFVAH
jgi:hypothetical protein